jgi:O-antigen ligase
MPSPDPRSLPLAILLVAGLQVGLPWALGGRSPVGQASLVLLLVLAAAAGLFPRGQGPRLVPSPPLLLGGILAAGSALHTIYPDRTVQSLLLLLAYLLAGTLAARGARELPWAERLLLTAISTSGALVTMFALYRLHQGGDEGVYARLLTGPFGYPNAMAGFLLLTGGASLAMGREDGSPLIRLGAMLAGVLAVVGLFLSGSRGVLLAGAIGLAVWAAGECRGWRPSRRLWLWLGGIGLLAALVWVAGSVSSFLPAWGRLGNPADDSSLQWRRQILHWTWAMAWDHPWWGVGPGAFPVALTRYQRIPYVSGENPHNLYLELAAEYGLAAGILAAVALGGFLGRVGAWLWRAPAKDPVRGRLAALLATLTAFAVHSLVDLDWSFPAIAVTVATLFGLTAAHLPPHPRPLPPGGRGKVRGVLPRILRPSGTMPLWRAILIVVLAVAALVSLTRFYASTLVTWGRLSLATGETATAQRHLTWALRLNPWSFPAHHWMAWASVRAGDAQGATQAAEGAARIAPLDPNSQYLAGEISAVMGRWDVAEDRFRAAVELAPSAQLRFHAGLVEATARRGNAGEAQTRYEQATAIFTPERVLEREARCLAPGDRYLLARISRIAARSYREAGDSSREQATMDRARMLAGPDPRGICVNQGRPGQTSPEAAMESFYRALAEGGWADAERYLSPRLRAARRVDTLMIERPPQARIAWVAALQGDVRQVNLRYELAIAPDRRMSRCAQSSLRLIGDTWYLDRLPALETEPCRP